MEWIDDLDAELKKLEVKQRKRKNDRSEITKGLVLIYLNSMVRFTINTGAEMKMLPNQWSIATYHGNKAWDLRKKCDFGQIDQMLLADTRPHGSAMVTEYFSKSGFERVRSGFLLPETIGGRKRWTFFVASESTLQKASLSKIWSSHRKGIEMWYDSVLRDDIAPFRKFCERNYPKASPPVIPDNL
jgi:hypothetical protein